MRVEFFSENKVSAVPVVATTRPDGGVEVTDADEANKTPFARFAGQWFATRSGERVELHAIYSRAQRWNAETAEARGAQPVFQY